MALRVPFPGSHQAASNSSRTTAGPVDPARVSVHPAVVQRLLRDADGAVLIPAAMAEMVAAEGPEQERLEAWIMNEVEAGAKLPRLYPPNAENRARYEGAKGR